MDNNKQDCLENKIEIDLNNIIIKYSVLKKIHKEIDQCIKISKYLDEPQCMSLEGDTGVGKSTIGKSFVESFERKKTENGIAIPCIFVSIPSPATIKDLSSAILKKLGDPFYYKGSKGNMTARIIGLLIDCEVKVVILDEFQHLIDKKTHLVLEQVSDWLKSVIKGTNIPFVVIGISGKAEIILKQNSQLSRLFAVREKIEPFELEESNISNFLEYSEIVNNFENRFLPLSQNMDRFELLQALCYATQGTIGNLKNLLAGASFFSLEDGRPYISSLDLSNANEKRLLKHTKLPDNPFEKMSDEEYIMDM